MSDNAAAFSARFSAAQTIAKEAGRIALQRFQNRGKLIIGRKGLQDFVSDADRETEAFIRKEIASRFPQDGFLGEESGANDALRDASHIWVVDPIDGTACFVNGIPTWCVSVALAIRGEIAIGAVYDPNADELFAAARGKGATLNGVPIVASAADDLSQGTVAVGFSHRVSPAPMLNILPKILAAGGVFQSIGSGAMSLCYVAAGRFLGYYETHINSWDAMAGVVITREAGGWTNDFFAGDCLTKGNQILVCAPAVSRQLRDICNVAC